MNVKNTSPFAALTSREQKERWICWQSQKSEQNQEETKPTIEKERSESVFEEPKPTESRLSTHHGQYSAVVNRMRLAGNSTQHYTDC